MNRLHVPFPPEANVKLGNRNDRISPTSNFLIVGPYPNYPLFINVRYVSVCFNFFISPPLSLVNFVRTTVNLQK